MGKFLFVMLLVLPLFTKAEEASEFNPYQAESASVQPPAPSKTGLSPTGLANRLVHQYASCQAHSENCELKTRVESCEQTHPQERVCHNTLQVTWVTPTLTQCRHFVEVFSPPENSERVGKWGAFSTLWLVPGPNADQACVVDFLYNPGDQAHLKGELTVPAGFKAAFVLEAHSRFSLNAQGQVNAALSTQQRLVAPMGKTTRLSLETDPEGRTLTVELDNLFNGWGLSSVSLAYLTVPANPEPLAQDIWENHCDEMTPLVESGYCVPKGEPVCSQGPENRILEGRAVTRPCWQHSKQFDCGRSNDNKTCAATVSSNCKQVKSTCLEEKSGLCIHYKDDYQCTYSVCHGKSVTCNQHFFCVTGECGGGKEHED